MNENTSDQKANVSGNFVLGVTAKKPFKGSFSKMSKSKRGLAEEEAIPTSIDKPMGKGRILKNLLMICTGQLLLFTAFDALANLQSTMNSDMGMGTSSQAVMYAFFNVSSFLLSTYVTKQLGCKSTLVASFFCFCPYIAANFYPHWYTLVPAAVLCGLVAGPLWSARSTYINELSFRYSSISGEAVEVVAATFFGIGCMFHQNTQIWGNLISYKILRPFNRTDVFQARKDGALFKCGAQFCPWDDSTMNTTNPNLEPPTEEKRFILTAVFLTSGVMAAMVICFFLDPLNAGSGTQARRSGSPHLFLAALRHLKKKKQLLLLPLTIYFGLGDGFHISDFTKVYVACAWGIHRVGFVMICYGVVSALMSVLSGPLVKYVSRPAVFTSAAVVNLASYITLSLWQPTPDQPIIFFIIAGAWGYGDAIWWSQTAALYGVLFKSEEEAAFSNFYFWNSLGFLVAYAYNNALCTHVKIYITLGLLALGMTGYLAVESEVIRSKDSSTLS